MRASHFDYMTPDPYECDAVLSVALLFAFCALVPTILTVSLPEWVVLVENDLPEDADTIYQIDGSAMDENPTEQYEEFSDYMYMPTDIATTTISAEIPEAGTDPPRELDLKKLTSLDEPNSHNDTANTEGVQEEDVGVAFPRERLVVADFHEFCKVSKANRSCWKLSSFKNCCQKNNESLNQDGMMTATDKIECGALILMKKMKEFSNYFKIVCFVAAASSIAYTFVIDLLAVLNKNERKFKLVIGILLASTGVAEILNVVFLQKMVIKDFPNTKSSTLHMGAASYFSLISGIAHILSFLVLCMPLPKRQMEAPMSESKLEIPFQNQEKESPEEMKIQYAPSEGFLIEDGDESEEWGYSPVVLETKEVRFELSSVTENDVQNNPEFQMYSKEITIFDLLRNEGDMPSTSAVKPNTSQIRECTEKSDESETSVEYNSPCIDNPYFETEVLRDALKEERTVYDVRHLHKDEKETISPREEIASSLSLQGSLQHEIGEDSCDSSERRSRTLSSEISYEMISDPEITSSNSTVGIMINDGIELILKNSLDSLMDTKKSDIRSEEEAVICEEKHQDCDVKIRTPSFFNTDDEIQDGNLFPPALVSVTQEKNEGEFDEHDNAGQQHNSFEHFPETPLSKTDGDRVITKSTNQINPDPDCAGVSPSQPVSDG